MTNTAPAVPRCSKNMYDDWYIVHQCKRKGRYVEDGMPYCKQHLPSAEKARQETSNARIIAMYKTSAAGRARNTAMERVCAGLSTAELEALGDGYLAKLASAVV